MSLRKQAKILGISPAHLSRMVNGIRPWNPGLKTRYQELTGNTFGNIRPVNEAEMVGFAPVNGRVGHDIAEGTSSTLVPPTTPCVRACIGEYWDMSVDKYEQIYKELLVR